MTAASETIENLSLLKGSKDGSLPANETPEVSTSQNTKKSELFNYYPLLFNDQISKIT